VLISSNVSSLYKKFVKIDNELNDIKKIKDYSVSIFLWLMVSINTVLTYFLIINNKRAI
jgi:hypothetical protein